MQDRVGQLFGNYRLVRLIGQGGHAKVYLAEHIKLPNLRHAIKILDSPDVQETQRTAFLAEARVMANLQGLSEHIVKIYDFDVHKGSNEDQDLPYFVMEYAASGTLRDSHPRGTRMSLEHIIFYIAQVAEALQCAHQQQPPVVHRDIKPENMLLRTPNHVLVSDFGIALESNTTTLPRSHISDIIGTAAYIAPERFNGRTKRASDQYSLAIVVYEWICGFRPFQGTNGEMIRQHLEMPPPSICDNYPEITPEMEAVVFQALAKKPEERYPSIQAFADALTSAVQNSSQARLGVATGPMPKKLEPQSPPAVNLLHISVPDPDDSTEQQSLYPIPPLPPLSRAKLDAQQPLLAPELIHKRPPLLPFSPAVPPQPGTSGMQPPHVVLPSLSALTPPRWSPTPHFPLAPQTNKRSSARRWRDLFDFAPQLAHTHQYRSFRVSGILLNILASCGIALLTQSIWLLPLGVLVTLTLFALCVRAVDEFLASCFGVMLACYWGWLGWLVASLLIVHSQVNHLIGSSICAMLFFIISATLHIRYALRKNA